jgi:hypothetical protein
LLLEDLDAAFTRSVTRDSSSTGTPTKDKDKDSAESDGSTLSLSGLLNSLDGVAGMFNFNTVFAWLTIGLQTVLQLLKAGEHLLYKCC